MNKITLGAVAAATLLLAGAAFAQQQPIPPVGPDWSQIQVKTTALGQRTYMLEGQGGNVTVAVADDGVMMVDGQSRRCTTSSRRRSKRCRSSRSAS